MTALEKPPTERPVEGAPPIATAPPRELARGWFWVAVLAAFLLAAVVVMIGAQWVQPTEEPWHSPKLAAAREQLLREPKNEELKQAIRRLDLQLRQGYFRGLERNRRGAWLLLAAGAALVWVARKEVRRRSAMAAAQAYSLMDREGEARRARTSVAVVAGVCGVAFAVMGLLAPRPEALTLPNSGPVAATQATAGPNAAVSAGTEAPRPTVSLAGPTAADLARYWPRFRGARGEGVVTHVTLPLTWDLKAGTGVRWKSEVSLPGYNSPVVWGNRLFLTGGNRQSRLVFCYDAADGRLLWQRPVTPTNAPVQAVEPPDQSGAAASTVATDGERVFAIFASGELGALDFLGTLVWHQQLDFSENGYGHASSLLVWNDRLIVQADQGQPEDGKSALHAFDTRTGKTLWSVKRPVGGSWATPIVGQVGDQPAVVVAGNPLLAAHRLDSGELIWSAKILGGELAPSPILADGLVVVASPGHAFLAMKLAGQGDVTASGVAWKTEEQVPDVPSPVAAGGLLYTASTEGLVVCRELSTGTKVWEHAYESEFQASPMILGNRLYLFAQPGKVWVLAAGREFKELAAFELGEEVFATPAVAEDRLFLRTKKQLICVGEAPAHAAAHAP